MKKLTESVFDDIYSSKKDEYKQSVPEFKNSKIVFEDNDTIIFKIGSREDLSKLPDMQEIDVHKWNNDTAYDTGQVYFIVDFESKGKTTSGVVTVYPNGVIDIPRELSEFKGKKVLKKKSQEEIYSLPITNLVTAYHMDKLHLGGIDFGIISDMIKQDASLIKGVNANLTDDDDLLHLAEVNPEIIKHMPKDLILALKKAQMRPEEREAYDDQDLYVFLAKDKFVETTDGMYKKDFEIESLNKFDQYDQRSQQELQMLLIRQRFQEGVELYVLQTRKGLIEDTLGDATWKINDDKYEWLRNAIRDNAVPYNKVQKKSI